MKKWIHTLLLTGATSLLSAFPHSNDVHSIGMEIDYVKPDKIEQYEAAIKEQFEALRKTHAFSYEIVTLRNVGRVEYAYIIKLKDEATGSEMIKQWKHTVPEKIGKPEWRRMQNQVMQTLQSYDIENFIYVPELSYEPKKENVDKQPTVTASPEAKKTPDTKPTLAPTDEETVYAIDNETIYTDDGQAYQVVYELQGTPNSQQAPKQMTQGNPEHVYVTIAYVFPDKRLEFEKLLTKWTKEQQEYNTGRTCKTYRANMGQDLPYYVIVGSRDCLWGMLKNNSQEARSLIRKVHHSDWVVVPELFYSPSQEATASSKK